MTEPEETSIQNLLRGLAALWIFPGLVISMVLGNQPFMPAQILGQILGLLNDLAAVFILLNAFRRKSWIFMLVTCIIVVKALRIVNMSDTSEIAYISLLNVLFCIAGSVVAFKHPNLVYKQVMVICLLNLIVMIFQVTGAGAWTQLLTTHGEGNLTESISTLFVSEDNLEYLLVQGRPAGISYSNVILSLIILFAIVLHFSRSKGMFWWGTPMLCGIVVLSMAKIAFLGFIITGILILFLGKGRQKLKILQASTLVVGFLGIYVLLFPGLFQVNLNIDTISTSFFLRANEIMAALNPGSYFKDMKIPYFEGTSHFYYGEEGEFVSGYASLITKIYNHVVLITFVLAFGTAFFILGLRRLNNFFHDLRVKIILTIFIIGIFPATHPIWAAPVYWFMIGPGFLPFFYLLRPRFINRINNL